jgi:short-subunit dehydrogenase|tara:strand:+ start:25484 stop:26275 length:792 start_codon:yes stop_codon:yes gene_type:complete
VSAKRLQKAFSGKVIWLTGASSGIGRALAIALSQFDCELYLSARSRKNLEQTASQCSSKAQVHLLPADLCLKSSNQTICSEIQQHQGRLDLAILNAGSCEYVDVDAFDSTVFEELIKTNFLSMVYGIESALPLLEQSEHAKLVGMSSVASYIGIPRSEAYGASKAAIFNMLSALRVSLSTKNICTQVICPGFVATELTARNDFPMPALISAEKASMAILNGMAKNHFEIHFPKRMSLSLKFLAYLPERLRFALLKLSMKPSRH